MLWFTPKQLIDFYWCLRDWSFQLLWGALSLLWQEGSFSEECTRCIIILSSRQFDQWCHPRGTAGPPDLLGGWVAIDNYKLAYDGPLAHFHYHHSPLFVTFETKVSVLFTVLNHSRIFCSFSCAIDSIKGSRRRPRWLFKVGRGHRLLCSSRSHKLYISSALWEAARLLFE